jgi:hypothetical protein
MLRLWPRRDVGPFDPGASRRALRSVAVTKETTVAHQGGDPMIDPVHAHAFLTCGRIAVVPGACPLIFLDPVRDTPRLHLAIRRLNGSVAKAA